MRLRASHFGGDFFQMFILNTWEKQKHKHATMSHEQQIHFCLTCPSLQHLNTQAPDSFWGLGEAAKDECSVGSIGKEGLWISVHPFGFR